MIQSSRRNKKKLGLVKIIFGSLVIGLPTIPIAANAQPLSTLDKVNPCPGIYYEEPFNSTRVVPQGCRPNAATQGISTRGIPPLSPSEPLTPTPAPMGVSQPPLPETRSNPIAMVMPTDETVDVKLKNDTNASISYEALGHTQRRFLPGGEEIVLQNLPTPVSITMVRQDDGLLRVIPVSSPQAEMLEISLQEETTLGNNQGVLRIQNDGQVFLN